MSVPGAQSNVKTTLFQCSVQLHSLNDARRALKQKYSTVGLEEIALSELVTKCEKIAKKLSSIGAEIDKSGYANLKKYFTIINDALNLQKKKLAKLLELAGVSSSSSSGVMAISKQEIERLDPVALLVAGLDETSNVNDAFIGVEKTVAMLEGNISFFEIGQDEFLKIIKNLKDSLKACRQASEAGNSTEVLQGVLSISMGVRELLSKQARNENDKEQNISHSPSTTSHSLEDNLRKSLDNLKRSFFEALIVGDFRNFYKCMETGLDSIGELLPRMNTKRDECSKELQRMKQVLESSRQAFVDKNKGAIAACFKEFSKGFQKLAEIAAQDQDKSVEEQKNERGDSLESKAKSSAKPQSNPKKPENEIRALLEKALQAFQSGNKKEGMNCIRKIESKKPAIAGKIYAKVWSLEGEALVKKNKKLAHLEFGKVAFFDQEGRSVSKTTRIKAVKAVLQAS